MSSPTASPAVTGFIGLGHLGAALARRLLEAGFPLVVHDTNPAAQEALVALGARGAHGPAQVAAEATVVFLCLPSVEAARAVAQSLAAGGALQVVVETSTVGPACVREMAQQLARGGIAVVDAPVSGGPSGAVAGTLSLMHAGAPQAVQLVMPQLAALATRRFDVGAEPGLAQVCKLVNNAISAAGMVAACEATVVGVKAGLDADTLLAAINAGSGRNAATLDKFPKAILPGTFDFGGPMGLMLKDLSLYLEQAEAAGVPQTVAPAALQAWQEAVDRSGFEADYSRVICHLENLAGVVVRSHSAPRE